jgi:hypothetical protein
LIVKGKPKQKLSKLIADGNQPHPQADGSMQVRCDYDTRNDTISITVSDIREKSPELGRAAYIWLMVVLWLGVPKGRKPMVSGAWLKLVGASRTAARG